MRVLGLVHGTHVIEDIGMDVPYGVTVTIPAEKAARSKDLHRAISSRCVFPLPSTATVTTPTINKAQEDALRRIVELEAETQRLQGDLQRLRQENDQQKAKLEVASQATGLNDGKLDAILAAIQSGAVLRGSGGAAQAVRAEDLVDGEAPLFIPSEIKLKDVESRIEVRTDEASSTGISDASDALRKLRRGQ